MRLDVTSRNVEVVLFTNLQGTGYARNNPLLYTDPTGMSYEICDNNGENCGTYSDKLYDKIRSDKSYIIASGAIYTRNKNGTQGDRLGSVTDKGRDLDDLGQAVAGGLGARVDASNQFIAAFAAGSVVAGTGVGVALQASGAGTLTTLGNITPNNLVYQSLNAVGDVQYVGITSNFAQREAAHAARLAIQRIPGLQNLTRADARAVEQVLIEDFGLAKNGGTLLNRINSIAASNPIYTNSVRVGAQILKSVGYPGF